MTSPTPSVFVAAVGMAIQRARQQAGISQQDLADSTGLHRTYISDIERKARNFSIGTYFRLAHALDLKPSELMREVETIVASDGPVEEKLESRLTPDE